MRKPLIDTVAETQGISLAEAEKLVEACRDDLFDRLASDGPESAYDICAEYFGLEPDYLEDLLY